jgi:L-seryl-tRNA(Ser) seleniumtransferase
MATTPVAELRARAESLAEAVAGLKPIDTDAVAGGGSLPGLTIPSVGVAIEHRDPDELHARLRSHGVVARVDDGRVVCDLRTVSPEDDRALLDALRATCE